MIANYMIHDDKYKEARSKGWLGWGGNQRIAQSHVLLDHLFVDERVPRQGELLELGCGEGSISRLFAKQGYKVTGIDISPTAIAWAKEKAQADEPHINYHQADLTTPDVLPLNKYDLIVDGNCLHCIIGADRKTFLKNVGHALKENGTFFVSTLCSKGEQDEIIKFEEYTYRWVASVNSLIAEIEAVGFSIRRKKVHVRETYNHLNLHANLSKVQQVI